MTRAERNQAPVDDISKRYVTVGVRVAAAWSWRLIVIVAALLLVAITVAYLRIVVIPLLVAILLAALLKPLIDRLHKWRWPHALAVVVALLVLLGIIVAIVWVISTQFSRGLADMSVRTKEFYEQAQIWLLDSPLHVTEDQINQVIEAVQMAIQSDTNALVDGVISVGSTAGHFVAGTLLAIFTLIFLLLDSHGIFKWVVGIFPEKTRAAVAGAGRVGWTTISSYVRVQIFVAFVDAVGITIVAAILNLPMLLPIGLLVFLASFVPFIGAIVSGLFVCLVALVYGGVWPALFMLIGVVVVQQLESHVLQPFIMGNAVKVHPLGVVFAVAIGALVAGIPGTLFAVPLVAAANVMIGYVGGGTWRRSGPSAEEPDEGPGAKEQLNS